MFSLKYVISRTDYELMYRTHFGVVVEVQNPGPDEQAPTRVGDH
jgi:hypothetical protein